MITEKALYAAIAARPNATIETVAEACGVSTAEVQAICWRLTGEVEVTRARVMEIGGVRDFTARRVHGWVYRIAGVPVRPGQKLGRQKQILARYVAGYSYSEIAEEFGITRNGVASSMYKMRQRTAR